MGKYTKFKEKRLTSWCERQNRSIEEISGSVATYKIGAKNLTDNNNTPD
jgi:hypothetical protein